MMTFRTGRLTAALMIGCALTLAARPVHAQVLYGSLVIDVRDQCAEQMRYLKVQRQPAIALMEQGPQVPHRWGAVRAWRQQR